LNAAWQTLFRDALNPVTRTSDPTTCTPPELPPPLRRAPNAPVGHDFSAKRPGSFRIWDANINGLSAKEGYSALHDLCASLKTRAVDAIAIQEPDLDFLQAPVRDAILEICKAHFEYARVVTSTSCIRAPSLWKPGGTLLIIVGKWAQAVARTLTDVLGHWTTVTLQGQDSRSVTLYSAYNVVKTTLKESGPSTVYAQQWQILRLSGVVAPNPRQHFIDNLRRDIQTRTTNGEAIILVGDFNELLGADPNLLASICGDFDLVDAHDHQHGEASMVPTYIRGSRRLDYCLVSPKLVNFIVHGGINLFNEFSHSDHRALFLDLDLIAYLGAKLPKLASPDQRSVSSSSRHVASFISNVYDHLQENKAFHKYVDPEPWRLANDIDEQAFALGEASCSSIPQHSWSENLHKASQKVRYWKTLIAARTTGVCQEQVLADLAREIWPDGRPTPPVNNYVLRKVKIAAERALKRTRRDGDKERKAFLRELLVREATRVAPAGTSEEVALKNIQRQLHDTKRFARISRTLKDQTAQALTKVEIVTPREYVHPRSGHRHVFHDTATIDVRHEFEAAIIAQNKRHFAQAKGTPFTQPPLKFINSTTGFNVYTDADDNEIQLPDTAFVKTATVMDILRARAKNPTTEWSPELDFDDFPSALLHWRESTSTSPSSRHLGLYKALATACYNSNGEFSNPLDPDDSEDIPTTERPSSSSSSSTVSPQRLRRTDFTCGDGYKLSTL
jgi:hypothetical protein